MDDLLLLFEGASRDDVTEPLLADLMDVAEDHGVPLTGISVGADEATE